MTNIVFVHRGGEEMASFRYRCANPGIQLKTHGHEVTYNGGDAHVCIFSKPVPEDLEVARKAKSSGCHIIVDIGDNHFHHPVLGRTYADFLLLADSVVCPTEVMRGIIGEFCEAPVTVIPDPYEMPQRPPHAQGRNVLWFGHQVNLKDITPYVNTPNLKIVTGPQIFEGATFWSPENIHRALSEASVVMLPTRPGSEYKSANRLLNAVRMGCFVVADQHPAYEEFKDMLWVRGVQTGMRWAKAWNDELDDRVLEAQAYILDKYSPEAIGDKWQALIKSL